MKYHFLPISSLLFLLTYGICYLLGVPAFYYLPVSSEFYLIKPDPELGPAMGWYGLMAAGMAAALLSPLVVKLMGNRLLRPACYWLLALVLLALVLVEEIHWFMS